MKKVFTLACVIVAATILTSCSVTAPYAVSSAPIGNKTGTSSTVVLFGFWQLNRDFGIAEAAHNGKITGGIATVDMKTKHCFLFMKKEIIVQGSN